MKTIFRIVGGLIFAVSYIYLVAPSFSMKVNLGILGLFVGFYIASNLVMWDLKDKFKTKQD